MNSTSRAERPVFNRRGVIGLAVAITMTVGSIHRADATTEGQPVTTSPHAETALLTARQLAIGPIATSAAVGDMPRLTAALNRGLEAGLTINEAKEVLIQLYAYAGFPRSLNALTELMKVADERRKRGLQDVVGREANAVPTGNELLAIGTANQTRLSGAPVRGPLFEFAPAIDRFLKAHLFGDIFARDNLDWKSRELATVAALSAMTGVESQLLSHVRISMNVGITAEQLSQFGDSLGAEGAADAAQRVRAALQKHLSEATKR